MFSEISTFRFPNFSFSPHASRLLTVNDGNNNTATYSYLANSPLVSQIVFKQSGSTRMTTTKQYDYLNRLTQISSAPSSTGILPVTFNYSYNAANQRTKNTFGDGSHWVYQYDALGQVSSGKRYWADGTPVAGQQYNYTFDTIGNRTQTQSGGDTNGLNLRVANYTVNTLNQYTARTVPGTNDIIGAALVGTNVTVNGVAADRKAEYFHGTAGTNNAAHAAWLGVTVTGAGATLGGHIYVPQTPEQFQYDLDGNLTNDGRWAYTWDAENRLIAMTVNTNVGPQYQLAFAYDSKGRRIEKVVTTNEVTFTTNAFVYDGWNLIATLSPLSSLQSTYTWGTDLSGTRQRAGGIGGLLEVSYHGTSNTNAFTAYDGNGNIMSFVNAVDGTVAASCEYGPFGEVVRQTGPMAKVNPFRFSTKYQDDESDLLYYGHRYYKASTGTWLNRDPKQEGGGLNIYQFVLNNPVNLIDPKGLWATDVHHAIISDWLDPYGKYRQYFTGCYCELNVEELLMEGSDKVDGAGCYFLNFPFAQTSDNAYQHAMRSPDQTAAEAQALYNQFMNTHILNAIMYAMDSGRKYDHDCDLQRKAIIELGMAYHSFSDSLSPAHRGFQVWYGPVDGVEEFGVQGYWDYLQAHEKAETMTVYQGMKTSVVDAVNSRFKSLLDGVLTLGVGGSL